MDFLKKLLNPFQKGEKRQYQDISKDSQKLPQDSPSDLLLSSCEVALHQLSEKIDTLPDCKWLRSEYTYPSFDNMVFSLGNQIFSVIIDIQDTKGESYLPSEFMVRQLHATDRNNLIPCKFPVVIPDPKEPDISQLKAKSEGWNLINTLTDEAINPEELITDEQIPLSEWEMRNFGINFIKKYLHAKRYEIYGFQDTLEVDPQIWFQDKNGKKCWILVRCEKASKQGILKPVKLNEIIRRCFTYDGYFAGIMLEPKDSQKEKICRGDEVKVIFNGPEKIHTVM